MKFATEASRIAVGRSDVTPARGDWRFKDPTWTENPIFSRIAKTYLAASNAVDSVVDNLAKEAPHRADQARFVAGILTSALAPTNYLLGNPAAMKRAFETGGSSLVSGVGNFLHDMRHNGGMPSMAKPGALKVGEDLAITPGDVVHRDHVAELLQYTPTTAKVRQRPVLVIPPPIGRYYFLDLRPGRSFVEYSVSRGLQTFLISWRNPSPDEAEWDLDTYTERVLEAIDTVREITGCDEISTIGFCAGGILNTLAMNYLSAQGERKVHNAAYAVTLLDFGRSAPIGAFSSARLLDVARANSQRQGVISAQAMGSVFSWMRPNDLVWNYWVNNYLMGQDPPVFDILSWNADGTNLPACLHKQFLDIFQFNPIVKSGALTVLDTPVDVASIHVPIYVTGAINDHLTPWKGCYQTTQVLSSTDVTFALSNAGHIASLVNPPDNPKASYYTGPVTRGEGADTWRAGASQVQGSWWEHWADWANKRGGKLIPAPTSAGSETYPSLGSAPGSYVSRAN